MKKQVFNPFLPLDEYIPDGEPHIFGDRVYLYGSHDFEGGETFCMGDYIVYSAPLDDLSDWRCEGVIYRAEQDPDYPERRYMYAPDVVQGNDGRFYLYYCMSGPCGFGGYFGPISVAVCDTPAGKYEYIGYVHYPDGTPMKKYVCFDPGVINDNGTIRVYYGTQYMDESNDVLEKDDEKMADVMKRYNKSREEILETADNVNGACMVILEDDMLTVRGEPCHIIPYETKGTSFEDHAFFEASSMRKIGDMYYFVYSSQLNHELCYATSRYPDRDFTFGGTIVSNGDVGFNGRAEADRLNMTGTTHGSIIEINGQWYVFYHRLTHKSDYSRQACAEKIDIAQDGSISQVEITSCGLNNGPLKGKGQYPAVIACNITNGHMPHGANKIYSESFPNVNHGCYYTIDKSLQKEDRAFKNTERYIDEICDGTLIGFKYFELKDVKRIGVTCKGEGRGIIKIRTSECGGDCGIIEVSPSDEWKDAFAEVSLENGVYPLFFIYEGEGNISLKNIIID